MTVLLPVLLGAAGALLLLAALRWADRRRRGRRTGRLATVDLRDRPARTLRSAEWRLSGRPDAVRIDGRGRWIPIEVKSRPAPRIGPPRSHRIQILAYCLLAEAESGASPPFGVLRYGDGFEVRIAWDRAARRELGAVRQAVAEPYRGAATPSRARCARCRWSAGCDRSVAVRAFPPVP